MKKILKFLFHRVVLVALALALQAGLLVLMLVKFNEYLYHPRRQKAEPPDQGENAPCGGQNAAGAAAAGGAAR